MCVYLCIYILYFVELSSKLFTEGLKEKNGKILHSLPLPIVVKKCLHQPIVYICLSDSRINFFYIPFNKYLFPFFSFYFFTSSQYNLVSTVGLDFFLRRMQFMQHLGIIICLQIVLIFKYSFFCLYFFRVFEKYNANG